MLTFVPHLRDLESNEETMYNVWLKELEEIDRKSGFKPMNREDKYSVTVQTERAAQVCLWLDKWLEFLAIPHCTKAALVTYLVPQFSDDAIDKDEIMRFYTDEMDAAAQVEALAAAELFVAALNLAFKKGQPPHEHIDLRKVMRQYTHPLTRLLPKDDDDQFETEYEIANKNLATYCDLGCLMCFSHSCEHGEYNDKNYKCNFSISSRDSLLVDLQRQRQRNVPKLHADEQKQHRPCHRECYREPSRFQVSSQQSWTDDDLIVLRSVYLTATTSTIQRDPICFASDFLDRYCFDVYAKFQTLQITLDEPPRTPQRVPIVKALPWYDRHKKVLLGDWQDHTIAHEHQSRDQFEPCSHEGPCTTHNCKCAAAGVLCDKYCGCTVETCAYKFTGCACRSMGKTCQAKQKEKPCICLQLNRECDPDLCGACGVIARADPDNADDERLHTIGCQNCDLQRGKSKSVILGKSQLDGCGYGLFAAESIAQEEFVIEYVGELITHDEGVRREARRGDVFNEKSNISYVFTLLEQEGIWVDAAMDGNLSRYINHAVQRCNIMPQIILVNGEYRIKFTALRDIEAGEELFFNYGENFPNLTKKLLDNKAGTESVPIKNGRGRPRRLERSDGVARKAPKVVQTTKTRGRKPKQPRVSRTKLSDMTEEAPVQVTPTRRGRKRKRGSSADSDAEAYQGKETSHTMDSTPELGDEEASALDTPSFDRMSTRRSTRVSRELESPARRHSVKSRGKRGGARPGSGRPRKHPRPDPQASSPTYATNADVQQWNNSPRRSRPSMGPPVVIEIEDSEDDDGVGAQNDGQPIDGDEGDEEEEADTNDGEEDVEEENREEEEDEDHEADAEAEEDEDDDVERPLRSSRRRRLPAKFRDSEL